MRIPWPAICSWLSILSFLPTSDSLGAGQPAEGIFTMDELRAGGSETSPAAGAIVFDGPPGEGRTGAKGVLFKAPQASSASTWTFRYSRSASAFPLQIIHPHRAGHVIICVDKAGVGVFSSSNWTGVGYGPGDDKALEKTAAFKAAFPLKDDTEYQIVSRMAGRGRYELFIDGKLVASQTFGNAKSLSLEIPSGKKFPRSGSGPLEFKGPDLPLRWESSWPALILGPVAAGAHICRSIHYYPELIDGAGVVDGLAARGVPAPEAPAPSPAAPAAPAAPLLASKAPVPSLPKALSAADLVRGYSSSLVFIQGSDGAGSGFIANLNNAEFLLTNAHVAVHARSATFKTLAGSQVSLGAPSGAVGHDIVRIAVTAGGSPLPVMERVEENASIGDEVVVLGNAEGAGVINTIKGRIVGIGPNLVEVDAPFKPGNSGSPIIHLKSGKVVGVATYVTIRKYDSATRQAVRDPIIRRFGYRLDSAKTWQPVNWQTFYEQAAELATIEKLTNDLVAFLRDLSAHGTVSRGVHTNPVIKNRVDQWVDVKAKRLSPRDAATADESMLSFLKLTCQSDVTAAQPRLTYDYFQRKLADQQRERTEIAGVFGKFIANVK